MPDYRRGRGPDQLPQGAATAVNAAQLPQGGGTGLPPGTEIPVQFAPEGGDDPGPDTGLTENMQLMVGPADPRFRPTPISTQGQPNRVPAHIVRHLPILAAAARNPESPVAMKALLLFITRRLEQEMQGR